MPPIHHHQIQGFFWGVIFKVSQPLDCFFFFSDVLVTLEIYHQEFLGKELFLFWLHLPTRKNMRLIHRPVNTQQSPVSWIPSNWILKGDRSLLISRKWVTRWWFQLSTITHLDGWGCVGSDGFHPHFKGGEIWEILGGGNSNIFYAHPYFVCRRTQFDDHMFQMGWFNHRPGKFAPKIAPSFRFPFNRTRITAWNKKKSRCCVW